MATTSADFLVQGVAHISVAPFGTTLPTYASLSTLLTGTFTGFTPIGETVTAVEIIDTPKLVAARSENQARDIDAYISEIETTIKTTLRELDEANLASVVRGTVTSTTGTDSIAPGGIGWAPKFSLAIVGPWVAGGNLLFVAERCVYSAAQTLAFSSAKATEIAIEFKILTPSAAGPAGGFVTYLPTPAVGSVGP